jgi:hypothetical protein
MKIGDSKIMSPQYTYENGMWIFHNANKQTMSKDIGIIYDKCAIGGNPCLMEHGEWGSITKRFKKYHESINIILESIFMDIRIVWVPPSEIKTLNKCIAISASHWCSTLENNVKYMEDCIIITKEFQINSF